MPVWILQSLFRKKDGGMACSGSFCQLITLNGVTGEISRFDVPLSSSVYGSLPSRFKSSTGILRFVNPWVRPGMTTHLRFVPSCIILRPLHLQAGDDGAPPGQRPMPGAVALSAAWFRLFFDTEGQCRHTRPQEEGFTDNVITWCPSKKHCF